VARGRRVGRALLAALGLVLIATPILPARAAVEAVEATPPVAIEFMAEYARLGGEASLGPAISNPGYVGDDLVQFFSRGRLDRAGRRSAAPFGRVVVAELGTLLAEATAQMDRAEFAPLAYLPGPADATYFAATGHILAPEFLDFWQQRGGVERFGAPIAEAMAVEGGRAQWFARGRLETRVLADGATAILAADVGREYLDLPAARRDELEYGPPFAGYPDPTTGLDVPILYYHQVLEGALFEGQVIGLLEAGFEPIPLARLVRALQGRADLPENPLVFTFDDGWESHVRVALPVLKRYRVPATFFVMPGFDEKEPGHLDRDGFQELVDAGMSVQPHTLNHADLPRLVAGDVGAAQAETVGSREALLEFGGRDYFAYPYGAVNDAVETLARASGYQAAVTTAIGRLHFPDELMRLKRVQLHPAADVATALEQIERALRRDPRFEEDG
jgi:peptidoglycan/xylan/chitin deacetylase (PgdA/CDA1 family)